MRSFRRLRSIGLIAAVFCSWSAAPAKAQSSGKAWENVVIDNKTGYWRVFSYWRTAKLLAADGTLTPIREPLGRQHKKDSDRKPLKVVSTAEPPADWTTPAFDHSAWPRQHGAYGPAPNNRATEWESGNPTELAMLCLRGKFEVKKPQAIKDLQVVLEYHGGAVVYINGVEIKRAHLPVGELKPGVLADKYPIGAYVKPDFQRCEQIRLRTLRVVVRPNMVKKGINIVAVAIHRAPINEILADQPRDRIGRAKLEFWSHAWVKGAMLHSGWGLTPRTAVASIDEPVVVKKKPGRDILNNQTGYWRTFARWKTVELISDNDEPRPLFQAPGRGARYGSGKPRAAYSTPRPPSQWADPDFDDSEWARVRGAFGPGWGASSVWGPGNPAALSAMCVRGRFMVTNPAACDDLQIALEYRGGVVVYVNGKELKRQHLPKGEIDLDTLATPYKPPAYLKPVGKLLHPRYDQKTYADHIRLYQLRALEMMIPARMLRKGVNVVAIEVHRAPVREILLTGMYHKLYAGRIPGPWPHAGLMKAQVRSMTQRFEEVPHPGCVPNLSRPEGVQVWNSRIVRRIDKWDYGNSCEPLHDIRIVGARGGSFGGHFAFGCTDPVEGLRASVSDLKCPGGTIPASQVELYYEKQEGDSFAWGFSRRFETLWPKPPAAIQPELKYGGLVQPIWLKIRVPRDAKPGKYAATLTINYQKGIRDINLKLQPPIKVPIALQVHDWLMPRPQEYRTFIDIIQSPESVAMRYKVPQWSREHFKYMKKSFDLLTEVGNKCVYLPLITRTHFGNSESILRYARQKDGSLTPDFSIVDRYMDLVEKTQGKPLVVILYLWERYTCAPRRGGTVSKMAPLVTEVDPATGKTREVAVPKFGTSEGKAFWGKVIKAIRRNMAKRGLEKALMLGIHGDWTRIPRASAKFFHDIAPGIPWVDQSHGLLGSVSVDRKVRVPVGYATTVWNARGPHDPRYEHSRYGRRNCSWKNTRLVCQFHRDLRRPSRNLFMYRNAAEWNITGHQRGLGRLGGDFWNVLKRGEKVIKDSRHAAGRTIVHRYPDHSSWYQLVVRTSFLATGPDGALPSVHFEMLREGVQNCEARIFIETALLDKGLRAKLGEDLAGRAQKVLDERTWMLASASQYAPWFFDAGFTDRQNRLYAAAADVAAALGAE